MAFKHSQFTQEEESKTGKPTTKTPAAPVSSTYRCVEGAGSPYVITSSKSK